MLAIMAVALNVLGRQWMFLAAAKQERDGRDESGPKLKRTHSVYERQSNRSHTDEETHLLTDHIVESICTLSKDVSCALHIL